MMPAVLDEFEHISRYRCPLSKQVKADVLPGEFYISQQQEIITTVLGSCIAVCLRDPVTGVAGMNHFLLPDCDASLPANQVKPVTYYGQWAMECLINGLMKYGARRERLEAKVFGAASVTRALISHDIGGRNRKFARQFLAKEAIDVIAEDTGGEQPRRIFFSTDSGAVEVHNHPAMADSVAKEEINYFKTIDQPPKTDIQFF